MLSKSRHARAVPVSCAISKKSLVAAGMRPSRQAIDHG